MQKRSVTLSQIQLYFTLIQQMIKSILQKLINIINFS